MADKQIQLQNKAKTDNLFPKVRIQDVDNLSTTLDGVVHKSGTETITGAKTFSADVSMRQDLSVEGNATFDNDVSITNASNLSVDGNITAANDLKFENELLNPDGDPYLEINSTIPSGATTAAITSIKFDGTYYLPPVTDLSHYATLDTVQTITANKTFTGSAYTFDDSELRLTNNTVLKTDTNINFYCGNDNQCYLRGLKGSIQSPGSVFADIYFDADDNSLNFDAGEYYVTASGTIFINSTNNDIHIQLGGGDSTFNFLSGDDLIFRTDGGYISMTTGGTSGSIAYFTTNSLTSGRYYDFPDTDGTLLTNNNSYEEYLKWGGGNKSGEVSPVGMALSSEHSSNRIAYVSPDAISVEYSTDGSTWQTMAITNDAKVALCTTSTYIPVGVDDGSDPRNVGSKTRITFTACNGTTTFFYTNPRKMLINISTSGIMTVLVEYRTGTNYLNDGAWETFGTYSLSGWSGWNDIPLILGTLGGGTDQYGNNWQLRLTFINGQLDPNYQTTADVYAIRIFGENAWTTPSNLARIGHLYDYDTSQNAFFPNDVYVNNQRLAKITEVPTAYVKDIDFNYNTRYLRKQNPAGSWTNITRVGTVTDVAVSGNQLVVSFADGTSQSYTLPSGGGGNASQIHSDNY